MTPNHAGLLIFGLILAGCIVAIVMDRPKELAKYQKLKAIRAAIEEVRK